MGELLKGSFLATFWDPPGDPPGGAYSHPGPPRGGPMGAIYGYPPGWPYSQNALYSGYMAEPGHMAVIASIPRLFLPEKPRGEAI